MLNSERIHSSRLAVTGEGLELLEPERPSTYVKPQLELSSDGATRTFRFRPSHRRTPGIGIKGQLAEYSSSSASQDTAPIRPAPTAINRAAAAAKRGLDITGALVLLVVFSPVFLIVALVVRATSVGPILFRQTRLGEHGREFTCLKFRTMVRDAEYQLIRQAELRKLYDTQFKIKDDPRVTPIGKLLRKTSLDELPQLFNVLQGTMSLVGPRPIVPPEIGKYGDYGQKLLTVRPGLTGVWQVCGRSETTYDERIIMDMFYVDHSSVAMDLTVLCSTVISVLTGRGAY